MPKVLIVDDEPDVRFVLRMQLELDGFSVEEAETGEAGIEMGRQSAPDVILLDLNLPGVGGRDVLRTIGADPNLARIPVLVVTAAAKPGAEEACLALGAKAYTSKLTRSTDLVRMIKGLIEPKSR